MLVSVKVGKYIRKIKMQMMLLGLIRLVDLEDRDRIHLEDLLGLLLSMKLDLSASVSTIVQMVVVVVKGRELIKYGICLVVRKSRGWRELSVI